MITEASARLVSKLMILCFMFTLCQLGSEFKSQSIAQTLPDDEGIFIINFIPFSSKPNEETIRRQQNIIQSK